MNSRSKALFIAKIIQDKKAQDVVILDMRQVSNITDFFVICSGNSTRQVKAITDYIIERSRESGHKIRYIEGYRYAVWVLLDCAGVVVHLFHGPRRDFYDLEGLWEDASRVGVPTLQSSGKSHIKSK